MGEEDSQGDFHYPALPIRGERTCTFVRIRDERTYGTSDSGPGPSPRADDDGVVRTNNAECACSLPALLCQKDIRSREEGGPFSPSPVPSLGTRRVNVGADVPISLSSTPLGDRSNRFGVLGARRFSVHAFAAGAQARLRKLLVGVMAIVLMAASLVGITAVPAFASTATTWTQLSPATSPPARYGATMSYDAATGTEILFGGFNNTGGFLNDTWAFSPATTTPTAPTAVHATGGNSSAAVTWTAPSSNGGSAITGYTVTPYIGSTAQTPQTFTSAATTETLTGLTNGTSYTFTVSASNSVGSSAASSASNAVTAVAPPPGPALSGRIAVAQNTNGNPELFATDTHGNLIHTYECATCVDGWSGWSILASGGFTGTPAVHADSTGRLQVAVRTTSGKLDVFWQNAPAAGPWDGPTVLGGGVNSTPALVAWPNGRLEVFATAATSATTEQVVHAWQTVPGTGNWTGEVGLGGNPMVHTHVAVGMNSGGYAEVFATSTSGQLIHSWFDTSGIGAWSAWLLLQPQAVMGSPSVGQNPDGRLEVFVRASNGSLYHTWQNTPSAGPWYSGDLGGSLGSSPVVTQTPGSQGGNLDVFAVSGGHVVVQRQEPLTATYWSGWQNLSGAPTGAVSVGLNGDLMLAIPTASGPRVSSSSGAGTWGTWNPAA